MSEDMLQEHSGLVLDGHKLAWHKDRVEAWNRGERVAPITIDMALTRACNFACHFCYAMLQENPRQRITKKVIFDFLDDCAEIGVKGVSFVSDGESTISPVFVDAVRHGSELGLSMASGTNGVVLNRRKLEEILPHLTYLRVNISAGERDRYAEIMGTKPKWFDQVIQNIRDMMDIKHKRGLDVTIGLQMVVMPQYHDQILPLAKLGQELMPDYLIFKHCSDDEDGSLGVDYQGYDTAFERLKEAETYAKPGYEVVVKWSKLKAEGTRSYQRCYGPPLMIQISGSGLVAPCGMLFNNRYKKMHIGNICETRFKAMWESDAYWDVMNYLSSPEWNAQKMCGSLCLQHKVNEYLDDYKKGLVVLSDPVGAPPQHINFI